MLRFDEYQSESGYFLDLLKAGVKDREEELIMTYIQQGPEVVRARAGVADDESWSLLFDRLVFADDVLVKCVSNFMPFFKGMVAEHGPIVIRKIFDIDDAKYDAVFEKLFDLIAVGGGALYDFVYRHREEFVLKIKRGDGGEIREVLCLGSKRYDVLWGEILRMLIDFVCDGLLADRMNEDGLKALAKLFGAARGEL